MLNCLHVLIYQSARSYYESPDGVDAPDVLIRLLTTVVDPDIAGSFSNLIPYFNIPPLNDTSGQLRLK
jgi:hypothetical protein